MDYENKYKEALERMKSWARGEHPECFAEAQKAAEFIFPELAESEDERIRKLCEILVRTCFMNELCTKEDKDDCIAWLEKQNSQILSNSAKTGKDESKFREGDWIISNDKKSIYQVIEVKRGIYVIRDNADNHEHHIGIEECEKSGRLWNISDAKDGDVLVDEDNNIGIYKEIEGICWHSYFYLGCNNHLYGFSIGGSHVQNNTKPATKEQRDTLFAKMKEAGYEWDNEKKEMKKIKQNPSWSEEDEKRLKRAIHIFEDNLENFENTGINDEIDESLISWLKTLKDRVQPKQEWSEEDWNYIADLISYFNGSSLQHDTPDVISWLKSLKPQTTWKPSEEQMKAIRLARSFVVDDFGEHPTLSEILMELEEQLKKLKG